MSYTNHSHVKILGENYKTNTKKTVFKLYGAGAGAGAKLIWLEPKLKPKF